MKITRKCSRLLVILLVSSLPLVACGPRDAWQPDANEPVVTPETTEPVRPAGTPEETGSGAGEKTQERSND